MNFTKILFIFFLIFQSQQAICNHLLLYVNRGGFKIGISRNDESTEATCTIKNNSASEVVWEETRSFNRVTGKFDNIDFPDVEGIPIDVASALFDAAIGYFTADIPNSEILEKGDS